MKNTTKYMFLFVMLTTIVSMNTIYGQRGKAAARVLKWIGVTVTAAAIEEVVKHEVDQIFYGAPYDKQPIKISIYNSYSYTLNFAVTNDGYNWYSYAVYPGNYLNLGSTRQGVLAVYNGRSYYMVSRSNTYDSSSFY